MHQQARALSEQGYTVLPGLLDAAAVRTVREAVVELGIAAEPPTFYAPEPTPVADGVFVTSSGLALTRLLGARPGLRPLILPERLLDLVEAALGSDAQLEIAGAMLSDRTRPFFRWHSHVDGQDEGARIAAGRWPVVPDVRRVLTLLYLDDLDDEAGPLYVLPRRAGDPTAPPGSIEDERWPGQVELKPRAGTLVAIDQCTWHAARSLRRPGLRAFVACYFRAASVAPIADADPTLGPLRGPA